MAKIYVIIYNITYNKNTGGSFMSYKNIFIDCCKQMSIDFDKVFGAIYSANITNGRVRCKSLYLNRKEDQLFVIGFSRKNNLYYVWRLKNRNITSIFSGKIQDTSSPNEQGLMFIDKNLEHSGHGKETVLVFDENHIMEFLVFVSEEIK